MTGCVVLVMSSCHDKDISNNCDKLCVLIKNWRTRCIEDRFVIDLRPKHWQLWLKDLQQIYSWWRDVHFYSWL